MKPRKKKSPPPRFATEFVAEEFIERHSRKGYLTRDFYVGTRCYRWTSNGVTKGGLIRYGILDTGA